MGNGQSQDGILDDNIVEKTKNAHIEISPNPMFNCIKISYKVEELKNVRIDVVDISGRLIKTIIDCEHAPGIHTVDWDGKNFKGKNVASGTYFIRASGYVTARISKLK
jgi:flagellar hook assembly protein FlgD